MTLYHLESPALTDLDAPVSPFIVKRATAGEGAAARIREVTGYVTPTASAATDSTFQFVRIPSTAIVKEIIINSASQGSAGGLFDVGVCYATDGLSAKSKLNHSPLVVADFPTNGRTAFAAAALDPESQSSWAIITPGMSLVVNGATPALAVPAKWTADTANEPIWKVIGLASDPGGNFDVVLACTEGLGTGAGIIGVSVRYTE